MTRASLLRPAALVLAAILTTACGMITLMPSLPGQIYVADQNNHRVVRFNDMSGAGWVTLGALGSGTNQFNNPPASSRTASA
ncbi:MAG: hypothetical protein QME77_11825 [bacterium]|nr:hypothetical protein [bacterium]